MSGFTTAVEPSGLEGEIDRISGVIDSKVIEWRRQIHANPDLSGHEYETTKMITGLPMGALLPKYCISIIA